MYRVGIFVSSAAKNMKSAAGTMMSYQILAWEEKNEATKEFIQATITAGDPVGRFAEFAPCARRSTGIRARVCGE